MRISQLFCVRWIAALAFAYATVRINSQYLWQLESDIVVINTDFEPVDIRLNSGISVTGCTRRQAQNVISTAAQAQDVLDVVLKARHHQDLGQMTSLDLLDIEHRYFGNLTKSLRHYMTEILEVIRNDWNQTHYICEEVCINILPSAEAYVYHEIPKIIHLCENFHLYRSAQYFSAVGYGGKNAPINGARTILHEKMHLVHHEVFHALSPKYMHPIADHANRPLACQKLVHDSPGLTFLNADSWASYMSEVYLGVKVGIPPRHLHMIIDTRVAGMEVFRFTPTSVEAQTTPAS